MTRKSDQVYNLFNALEDVKSSTLELLCGCLPRDVGKHLRAARRERLLALRSMIDAALERMEEAEEAAAGSRSEKVDIE